MDWGRFALGSAVGFVIGTILVALMSRYWFKP
jgi:hypothetical protein